MLSFDDEMMGNPAADEMGADKDPASRGWLPTYQRILGTRASIAAL